MKSVVKFNWRIILVALVIVPGAVCSASSLKDIRARLTSSPCHKGKVAYEVWMPSAADPVVYDIEIMEMLPGDTLSPSDYLISWKLPRGGKVSTGFASYHGGDHFRYRNNRLQEYHYSGDPTPFTSAGGGVQRTAQFVDLLPAYLAEKLDEIASDTTYQYEFNARDNTLSGTRRVGGYDALEFTYTFDEKTGMPRQIDFVFNPASISEQTVTAKYTWDDVKGSVCPTIDEAYLIKVYPEEFGKFRTSNFRVENLQGAPIPAFSYDQTSGQRITHSRGEADLSSPVLLVFEDASSNGYGVSLEAVRSAINTVPMQLTTLWAFSDNDVPESFVPQNNEYLLNGPQGFIVKCGVTAYPTFLLVNSDGTVAQVIIGNSNDLETTLGQSLLLLH